MRISINASQPLVRFTGFYGEPKHEERIHSWMLLKRLAGASLGAWCVGGDFNEILKDGEKFGGPPRAPFLINNFREALSSCDLTKIPGQGEAPTWCNGRTGEDRVSCKLDRAVGNSEFFNIFPAASVSQVYARSSDHVLILLSFVHSGGKPPMKIRNHRFFYEVTWAKDSECIDILSKIWKTDSRISDAEALINSGVLLRRWKSKRKSNASMEIRSLENSIKTCRNVQLDMKTKEQIADCQAKLVKLLDEQELHWKQRAKVLWYLKGDRNTRFFSR